ncbi:unnamed protein product, partial [Rotaria sp. Silwood1]
MMNDTLFEVFLEAVKKKFVYSIGEMSSVWSLIQDLISTKYLNQ